MLRVFEDCKEGSRDGVGWQGGSRISRTKRFCIDIVIRENKRQSMPHGSMCYVLTEIFFVCLSYVGVVEDGGGVAEGNGVFGWALKKNR